jgi:predicted nucleotidyltransferase
MNRLKALIHQRAAGRLLSARERAGRIIRDAKSLGIDVSIVGSLAKNSFKAHSDIDLLVHGSAAPHRRARVERLVADHMRGSDIPYDLIFEVDLTSERLEELLHDAV